MRSVASFDREVLASAGGRSLTSPEWIRDAYDTYTRKVSDPSMAISYELSLELCRILECFRPSSVLELGSGFSTYVLARALSATGARLVSCDDDPVWASKTEMYLKEQGLPSPRVGLINSTPYNSQFDLVFLDLNYVEIRKDFLQASYEYCKSKGLLILDDAHKPNYMSEILSRCRRWRGSLYTLKHRTLDSMGRYSVAFHKQ
jgi:predicted O-methyltransferase YrrM